MNFLNYKCPKCNKTLMDLNHNGHKHKRLEPPNIHDFWCKECRISLTIIEDWSKRYEKN